MWRNNIRHHAWLLIRPVPLLNTSYRLPVCYPLFRGPTFSWDSSQTRQVPPNIAGDLEGEGNDIIPPHLTGNKNPPQIRQMDKGWGREPTSHLVLFPLHPLKKKSQTLAMQTPAPHPTHSSVCRIPRRAAPRQLPVLLPLWFLLATPCPLPCLSLQLSHSASSITYSDLLSVLWPPCLRASREAASLTSSSQQGPTRPCLPSMWDSHCCPALLEVRG